MNDTQAQVILQSPAQTSAANPQTGGSFNFPVTATLGATSVTLSAVDRAGNAATATASFTLQSILGKLETISCDNLTGYALNTGNLAQSIQVEVLVNGQLFTTVTAGDPRSDLGPYNGNHGLTWAIPVAWKDGQGRTIQLRSQGTVLEVNANAGANSNGAATVNGNTVTLTCAPNAQKTLYFIEPDHLGTPRNVQNQTQQTVWRWDQNEAFGNNAPNENPSNLGAFVFPLRFPGQYADVETGLFYNYFRDYNPVVGGYSQSDPIGLKGGINTYAYVKGSPLMLVDPEGLRWASPVPGEDRNADTPEQPNQPNYGPSAPMLPPGVSPACVAACLAVKTVAGYGAGAFFGAGASSAISLGTAMATTGGKVLSGTGSFAQAISRGSNSTPGTAAAVAIGLGACIKWCQDDPFSCPAPWNTPGNPNYPSLPRLPTPR